MRAVFEDVIEAAGTRPDNSAGRAAKKRYGELISMGLARSMASDLRQRGLAGILPSAEGGGERTFAGGIGAKRVDVSWAREQAGLLLALSLKTINFPDGSSGNYQKNLTNRRGDMLFEAVTLHRRFPFAVLGGFLFFHEGAMLDATENRSSKCRWTRGAVRENLHRIVQQRLSLYRAPLRSWPTHPSRFVGYCLSTLTR